MKAIILAAGTGLRMNGVCEGSPKCLLNFGGQALIEHQLEALRCHGISDVVVVTGYKSGMVREYCGRRITFIENEIFDRTNSLYSLWLARDHMSDGFIVINSDVLFHQSLLGRLIDCGEEDALLVEIREPGMPPLGEEEMKVIVLDGRVAEISKNIPGFSADGENVGIVKFGAEGAALLAELMDPLVRNGSPNEWAPRAFLEFSRHRPLHVISTAGLPWIEIDFPDDYARALRHVFPAITRSKHIAAPAEEADAFSRLATDAITG